MSNVAVVTIGGSTVTTRVRLAGLHVQDVLNEPKRCAFRIDGSAPSAGAELKIGLGDTTTANLLFAGIITRVTQSFEGKPANQCWDVQADDYTFLINRRLPFGTYRAQSATTIATWLISSYASGFTSTNVQASLPTVTITFDGTENLMSCLRTLATAAGCYAYIDYTKDLHFFSTESSAAPDTIDGTGTNFQLEPPFSSDQDLSQVRTRVYVKGPGATVQQPAAAGSTVVFVSDIAPFSAAGGSAITSDGQIITYTGRSPQYGSTTVAARATPTDPGVTRNAVGAGAPDATGSWQIEVSFGYVDSTESLPSTADTIAITGPNDGFHIPLPLGVSGIVTKRFVYFKKPSDTFKRPGIGGTINDNTTASEDVSAQLGGGVTAPQSSAAAYAAGVTYIFVTDISQFNATGGSVQYGARTFTYTAAVGSAGVGALTGIPASGTGSIAVTINIGDTIAYIPTAADYYLTGIPPTGAGSINGVAAGSSTAIARPAPGDPGATRLASGAGVPDATGTWNIKIAWGYSDATESLPSVADAIAITGPNDGFRIPLLIGDTNVTKRYVYFQKPTDTYKRPATGGTINDNTTTTEDVSAQLGGGATAPQSSAANYAAGSTYVYVNDCAQFALNGGTVQYGTRVFTYTAVSANSGNGYLLGIPSAGSGSIAATITVGDTLTCLSTGIGIAKSQAIAVWVQRDNAAAQTALAALEGGDGIHEHMISDSTLATIADCQIRGDADLALFKAAILTVSYATRDLKSKSGKTVTVNIGAPTSVSGTFKIQRVTIDQVDLCSGRLGPRLMVEASNTKYSLEDLLRKLTAAAA